MKQPETQVADTPEEMVRLGGLAAAWVQPGGVIALVGGLGAGKTHWVKGLVAALGSRDEVTSPTFGLVHEYSGGRLPVLHLDFYRLADEGELLALGWDEMIESDAVVVVEWADRFPAVFPAATRWFGFSLDPGGRRVIKDWGTEVRRSED